MFRIYYRVQNDKGSAIFSLLKGRKKSLKVDLPHPPFYYFLRVKGENYLATFSFFTSQKIA